MLDKKYLQKITKSILNYTKKRRDIIKLAGDAQHLSKKAIFELQKGGNQPADNNIKTAAKMLNSIAKKFGNEKGLLNEGAYKAALEEFVEACLFRNFVQGKKIGEIKEVAINTDIYISGLADVPGEILRYAIKAATERDFTTVKKCYAGGQEVLQVLMNMDLTGYNRQKYDQAKQALNKLQQVVYDVSLRT